MIDASGYLNWDSEFFKKEIAFIDGFRANERQIRAQINHFFDTGADCIYLYTWKLIDLNGYDFILADRKRIYLLNKPEFKEMTIPYVKIPKYKGNPSELYELALQSGEHSRFKIDNHFSDDEFSNLYKRWVDNSVNEGFADYVLVVLDPDPVGFITAKVKTDRICIGLFATDKNYRGRGIGTRLMQEVINEASKKGLKVEVVTQADNEAACHFYESKGFVKSDDQYVYHIWNHKQT